MTRTTTRDPYAPVSPEIAAQVAQIMRRPYRKMLSGDAGEGFLIEVPDLPGCMTAGETEAEAISLLPEAMAAWLESVLLEGEEVPEPTPVPQCSGKMLIQMPKTLHQRLIERAEVEGVTANQLAVALLAEHL